MVFKLIGTLACIVLISFFAGFNLDHKCDVFVFFTTIRDAPVFLTIVVSFAAGILFTIPFAFGHRITKKDGEKRERKNQTGRTLPFLRRKEAGNAAARGKTASTAAPAQDARTDAASSDAGASADGRNAAAGQGNGENA